MEKDTTIDLEGVLKLVDQSIEILDRIEAIIGSLATHINSREVPPKGSIYQLYSLVVRLRDNLIKIRDISTRRAN